MRYIITKQRDDVPEGFRNLTEQEVANEFLKVDVDKSYFITKNEWMVSCLKMLISDVASLDNEGPDSIMGKIQSLSEEFDRYDLDKNKHIDYDEYKNFLLNNIFVSE